MKETTRRGIKEGIGFGLVAGAIFVVADVISAAMMDAPPITPIRMYASVVLGQEALTQTATGTAVAVGLVTHFVLSGLFGLVYGVINGNLSRETETSYGRQVGIGLLFGAALWLVNFHLIARLLYPWFLEVPQFAAMVKHAVFFGLPLALMYAAAERRAYHITRPARVRA